MAKAEKINGRIKKNRNKIKTILILVCFFVLTRGICSAFTVVHISDIHAAKNKKRVASGDRNNVIYPRMYKRCLREVRNLNADLVIATGDITNSGQRSYYKKVLKRMRGIDVVWVKGNHDDMDYNKIFGLDDYYYTERENWRIIVLNSSVFNKRSIGGLDAVQIDFLKASQNTEKNILVAMHHPIFEEASLKPIENYSDFKSALGPNVKYVLSGHWHSGYETDSGGIHYQVQEALSRNGTCHYSIINLDQVGDPEEESMN